MSHFYTYMYYYLNKNRETPADFKYGTHYNNVQHHNIIKKKLLRSKLVDPNLFQLSRLVTLAFQG